jgi:histidyl-tRNA synthetase
MPNDPAPNTPHPPHPPHTPHTPHTPPATGGSAKVRQSHQAPKGTRDLYPADAAKRRFLTEAWRSASVRFGFDEIDGPTFEHLDLYTVKSGEGIISELFSFRRAGGDDDYALRPEFTPTLARMYAAQARQLPRPTKWFMAGPFFRAERPQRGRLREFLQWNADFLGLDVPDDASDEAKLESKARADAEIISCCIGLLRELGLTHEQIRVKVNHRHALSSWLTSRGIEAARHVELFTLLDAKGKMRPEEFAAKLGAFGFSTQQAEIFQHGLVRVTIDNPPGAPSDEVLDLTFFSEAVAPLVKALTAAGVLDWIDFDLSIVRGLAYYTGMVFEVHEAGGKERAIAGGGRYDGLVELFGGPSTPAVGFGMGDVVLSLVLEDRGLMPAGTSLLGRIGNRPDAFVISNGTPEADAALKPIVAALRSAGLHARHTYKATGKIGKLMKDATASGARFAIILESGTHATLKDLDAGTQEAMVALDRLVERVKSTRPR